MTLSEGQRVVRHTREWLTKELGREPTNVEIARELDLPTSAIDYLLAEEGK